MRTFLLLGFAACALLACGGKVVLDSTGAGGTGSGTGGQGGASAGGDACAGPIAALDAAIEAAQACDPDASTDPCTTTVPDRCGCLVLANAQGNAAAEAEAAYQAARAAGCICYTACPNSLTSGQCVPTSSGGRCGE